MSVWEMNTEETVIDWRGYDRFPGVQNVKSVWRAFR